MTLEEAVGALVAGGLAARLDHGAVFGGREVLPALGDSPAVWHGSFVIEPKGDRWNLRFAGGTKDPEREIMRLKDAVEMAITASALLADGGSEAMLVLSDYLADPVCPRR